MISGSLTAIRLAVASWWNDYPFDCGLHCHACRSLFHCLKADWTSFKIRRMQQEKGDCSLLHVACLARKQNIEDAYLTASDSYWKRKSHAVCSSACFYLYRAGIIQKLDQGLRCSRFLSLSSSVRVCVRVCLCMLPRAPRIWPQLTPCMNFFFAQQLMAGRQWITTTVDPFAS